MKKSRLFCALLVCAFGVSVLQAQAELDFAFSQLKGNGAVPFANALYQDPDNAQRLANRLAPLLQGAGEFSGHEVLSRRYLAKKIERVVIVLYFEKFPVYMRIDLYDTARGKVWLPASVSRDATDILPLEIISAAGK